MTFHIYDTTLRDGSQQEGLTLSVEDKLQVARLLDELGVNYIEGGWPGAVPKDTAFFARAQVELQLKHAKLAAFGATRKVGLTVEADPQVQALLDSGAPTITLVAKSDARHVELALRTTLAENLNMVRETVAYLVAAGREVFIDAEHFFDGFDFNPEYSTQVVATAFEAGSQVVVLCDTNGGNLPHQVEAAIRELQHRLNALGIKQPQLGVHMHNDSGCAIANSVAAVRLGAMQVQGCINGYGERTGNADLIPVVANLQLKMGMQLLSEEQLRSATRIANAIGEIVNYPTQPRAPYVGFSAFAHKAGLHASAIKVNADLYQHLDPVVVGNDMRMIISDMAGRASIELKAREFGFDLRGDQEKLSHLTQLVKEREASGYSYEAADASFDLLLQQELGTARQIIEVESWRTSTNQLKDGSLESEAVVRITPLGGAGQSFSRQVTVAEGNGPVNALDKALRSALSESYPEIADFELIDFKVRILDSQHGTDATTRVLVTTQIPGQQFTTVGVGTNIIEASWEALCEAYTYGVLVSAKEAQS